MKRFCFLLVLLNNLCCLGAQARDFEKQDLNLSFAAPDTSDWKIWQDGILPNTTIYVFSEAQIIGQSASKTLSVMVIPSSPDFPTLESMKDGWEKGFLKKATKKLFSDSIQVDGITGYRVAAEATANGHDGEAMAVEVVYKGHNYSFTIFHVGPGVKDDPDFAALMDSIKFKK